ncbi:4Fe-4S cluster-binding domain-containing protein [Candidatus Pacearchaeota archaeon]|nr:4Fe-4S cluster-binding domain-containing protein [Candidatus Pacearchaeota archaeon]
MKFPWHKYTEKPLARRNTLQVFVTNDCNLKCGGCFARNAMGDDKSNISLEEYTQAINQFLEKGGRQVNILGGEPMLHPKLLDLLDINKQKNLKTTVYTNGYFMDKFSREDFEGVKLRVSIYGKSSKNKAAYGLSQTDIPFDANFMVGADTTLEDLLESAKHVEIDFGCKVFFISSIRELDNERQEFFDDTKRTMPVLKYKELVHNFLNQYEGDMDVHISKRGIFESTQTVADNKCRFANYFIGEKIIQCPYDVVNLKFQKDYDFEKRYCQQNSSCLMSKIVLQTKK